MWAVIKSQKSDFTSSIHIKKCSVCVHDLLWHSGRKLCKWICHHCCTRGTRAARIKMSGDASDIMLNALQLQLFNCLCDIIYWLLGVSDYKLIFLHNLLAIIWNYLYVFMSDCKLSPFEHTILKKCFLKHCYKV